MNIVINNLWRKAELLKARNVRHEAIRPLLLILPGGNLGVDSAAACYALHRLGLGDVFDIVVGMSTGAWVGAYHLAGEEQIKIGASIYYEEFATPEYINFWKFPYVMNPGIIEGVTSIGRKKLNIEAVKKSRSQLHVGVTDMNGVGHFLDVKNVSNPWSALYASSAIPVGYREPKDVDGKKYLDGGIALSFPIEKVIEKFSPTDVLVLPNCPRDHRSQSSFLERAFVKTFLDHLPKPVQEKICSRHSDFSAGIQYAQGNRNIAVLWPVNTGLHLLTRDPKKLRDGAVLATQRVREVFNKRHVEVQLY